MRKNKNSVMVVTDSKGSVSRIWKLSKVSGVSREAANRKGAFSSRSLA